MYGEYIYNRENCRKCHTQKDGEDTTRVSLDGLAGNKSNAWHFQHLAAPQSISINSKMPAFSYLIDRDLDKQVFIKLGTDKFGSTFFPAIEGSWSALNSEADTIQNDLKALYIRVKSKSEIIALIAYLQQIPKSDNRIKNEAVYTELLKKKEQAWDNLVLDSNSIVFTTARNYDHADLENGKLLYNKKYCSSCHGRNGEGSVGPNLTDDYWLHGSSELNIARSIITGYPDRGMMPWRLELNPTEVGQLVAYIRSLKGTNPKNAKQRQGTKD